MLNTIGYEGAAPRDFIQTLVVADVNLVIDIRDRAQSRRPGFSKSALATSLECAGIGYVHYRELGDPKEGREAARANDMSRFRAIFGEVLKTDRAQAAIARVAEASLTQNVCLLCYERDVANCHRKLVAEKVTIQTGVRARHLGVRTFEPDRQQSR